MQKQKINHPYLYQFPFPGLGTTKVFQAFTDSVSLLTKAEVSGYGWLLSFWFS